MFNNTVHLLLLLLALWKWVTITTAPVMIISATTNISYYFSLETKSFDLHKNEAILIASQPIFTWDVYYTIPSQQSSNMPSFTTTSECITEASIEINTTSSTNWQSTNVYEGIEGQLSSTSDVTTIFPLCGLDPALIPPPGSSNGTFSAIFFACWAIGAVVLSIAATCVIRCRLRQRAKNIQVSSDTTQEVRYQTPTLEHYEAEISIPIDA